MVPDGQGPSGVMVMLIKKGDNTYKKGDNAYKKGVGSVGGCVRFYRRARL